MEVKTTCEIHSMHEYAVDTDCDRQWVALEELKEHLEFLASAELNFIKLDYKSYVQGHREALLFIKKELDEARE